MSVKRDARTQLIEAAERLFAQHSVETVSMREIVEAAGQRNNAAIQYHFGGREGLVRALYEYRVPPLSRRRHELLNYLHASGAPVDVRAVVTAFTQPLVEAALEEPSTWYARFLNRVMTNGDERPDRIDAATDNGASECIRLLRERLPHLPPPIMDVRLLQMTLLVTASAADLERRREKGTPLALPLQAYTANLVDGATALLTAPVSPAAATGTSAGRPSSATAAERR
ncbi:TetR/AcrR family transcriptional regulator [Yinghuangia aomiensis]